MKGWGVIYPPVGLTSITKIDSPWHFAAFSNMSLETFVPNLVYLTRPNLQILGKTHDLWSTLMKENCHNSRTSDDIDIKLGSVTKIDRRNKKMSKKLTLKSCQQIVTSLLFFWFIADLEQSGSWTPDEQSIKLIFSKIATWKKH